MGAPHQKDHDQKTGTFSPNPYTLGKGEEVEIELIINYSYMMKRPDKSLKYGVQRASELLNTSRYWEGGTPREGMEALHSFPHTFPCASLPVVPELYPFIINQ